MIPKKYRLTEHQVKKVLRKWKPFFSFGIVSNSISNNLGFNRFAIVLGSKSVNSGVHRNFFRRKFYSLVEDSISVSSKDIVFVVKTKNHLDPNQKKVRDNFKKDILFLLNKIF